MSSPSPRRHLARRFLAATLTVILCVSMAPTAAGDDGDDEDIERLQALSLTMAGLVPPAVLEPRWIAESALPPVEREVRFRVTSTGDIETDLDDFADAAQIIFDDPRGWRRAGVSFTLVEEGPADVNVVLASPAGVASYGFPCSAEFSCRTGNNVVINDERWRTATDAWNDTEASLLDYRRMVTNHEMGHWLGHGHLHCSAPGEPAPLMQQQSKSLQGCEPNPWPLDDELDLVRR